MTYSGAVIGIQARGLAGQDSPHSTVEAMAEEYLREIKRWQPDGPYYLCGYSFGGLVAFEMARRLLQSGDKVGLVALFDTRINSQRGLLQSLRSLLHVHMRQFAALARATPVHAWPRAASRVVSGVLQELRAYAAPARDGQSMPGFLKYAPSRVLTVGASSLIASARYHPGFYPGELSLFRAVEREQGGACLEAVWRKHARSLRIVETAGTHSTMLAVPNSECAASLLTQLLPVMRPES
jgi:thioesterase domain-containing protein